MVDSVGQGNLSKTEEKLMITSALNRLQEHSKNNEHTPGVLDISIDTLDEIINLSKTSNVSLPNAVVVTTIDNLLAEKHTSSWTDTSTNKASVRVNKILKTVDKFGMLILGTLKKNESITFNTTKNMGIPYLAVKYKTVGIIMNGDNRKNSTSKYKVDSDIMSLTLKTDFPKRTLNPPLQLKFLKKENFNNSITECAFWNFDSNNGNGWWSTTGCETLSTNDLYMLCQCNHLTNFAILVRLYTRSHMDEEALNWISLTGCSISIFFSLLTIFVYLTFWKSITTDITRTVDKITLFLCLSIAMAYAVFLVGADKTKSEVWCTVMAAVLQCLFLVIFFLMLALGWYYFVSLSLVKLSFSKATKFKSDSNILSKIVWGIVLVMPVFITAVTFGIVSSSGKDYHMKTSCWLSFESGALYGFIGPVALIILVNMVIVINLCVTICSSKIMSNSTVKKRALSGIKSMSILLPVLGVTWVFGFLSINDDVIVFQYIFAILNSFQGLFIFVSKCLLNKKIRKAFIRNICIKKTESKRSKVYTQESNITQSSNIKTSSSEARVQFKGDGGNEYVSEDMVKGISFSLKENTAL